MKKLIPLALMMIAAQAFPTVQRDSVWPDDAVIINDLVETLLLRSCLVSLDGPDSALVLFVSLGGEWTASDSNWNDLMVIYAAASGVDMEKPWSIRDVAVSFGESWCSIPMEDIFSLSADSLLSEEEWWAELESFTEVHIRE
jgi:hypothetical protein